MRASSVAIATVALLLSACTGAHDATGPTTAGVSSAASGATATAAPASSTQSATAGDAGWMPSADIPLASKYHWPNLADSAQTVISPRFRFENLCHSSVMEYRDHLESDGTAARRAQSPAQDSSDWQVEQTIITWKPDPTDPQGPDNGRYFFNEVQGELTECGSAHVQLGTDGTSLNYTISGTDDVTAHGYVVWAPGYCALSELVLSASGQKSAQWTNDDPAATTAALAAALKTGPRCT